jgi:two-component system NtrC family sensor kinase
VPRRPAHGKRILIVEDDAEVAAALVRLLSIDGHKSDTAPDGALAVDKLAAGAYDFILSDIKMPGLDGPGFYRELERRHPHLLPRIAFYTGDLGGADTQEFLESTGAPCVKKPVTLAEIRRVLREVLGELDAE